MAAAPRFHVLLVGIDSYQSRPLHGCVNDIDAVQRLLIERAGIEDELITRLASPHSGDKHETKVAEKPATLANIRAALRAARLRGCQAGRPGIHLLFRARWRSMATGPQGTFACESLVPVDYDAMPGLLQLLPDFEFNRLLAGIAKRTLGGRRPRLLSFDWRDQGAAGRLRDDAPLLGLLQQPRSHRVLAGGCGTGEVARRRDGVRERG